MGELILPPESDTGNIEYKYKLDNLNNLAIQKKMSQLQYRMNEGNGEAIYYIGVYNNGKIDGLSEEDWQESIKNLELISSKIGATIINVNTITLKNGKKYSEFIIREYSEDTYLDLKIGVIGNVDSGKSSLVGVLTKGVADNGRGSARSLVFNFKHEVESGRTSSIGHQIAGFNKNGEIINCKKNGLPLKWNEITKEATKIVTFYDLAGHEKYLRTTIYGLSSSYPDYCLVIAGANLGISHMTREHIGLCLALKIPFIVIITKIDLAPEDILQETVRRINQMCKNGARKIPYNIKTKDDVLTVSKNIKSDTIVPIIQLSSVTLENMDLLKLLLNLLPMRNDYSQFINQHIELLIDSHFYITGHGTVVSGLLTSGTIKINDSVLVGPTLNGEYLPTKIKSIHIKHSDVKEGKAGIYISVNIKNIQRKMIRKGMVIIGENAEKKLIREFWVKIVLFQSHSTTISVGYEPYIHIAQVRQISKILKIEKINDSDDNQILRTGDRAFIKLRFNKCAEYIKTDMNLVFRDGKVKAFGVIVPDRD